GFEVSDKPTSKLTEEMYSALHKEFAKDKATKQNSDEIALPKGNANIDERLTKDEIEFATKEKKIKAVAAKATAKKVKEEVNPTTVEEVTPEPIVEDKPTHAPTPVEPVAVETTPVPTPVKQEPLVQEQTISKEEIPTPKVDVVK